MMSRALISKIHCTLSANQKRDSEFSVYVTAGFPVETYLGSRMHVGGLFKR